MGEETKALIGRLFRYGNTYDRSDPDAVQRAQDMHNAAGLLNYLTAQVEGATPVAWFRQSVQNDQSWYQMNDAERRFYAERGAKIVGLFDPTHT